MAKAAGKHVDVDTDKWLAAKRWEAYGLLLWLGERMEERDTQEIIMYELTLTSPGKTGSDYRLRIKAEDGGQQLWIAFVNGSTVEEAMLGLKRVYEQRGLAWREDLPYAERVRRAEEKGRPAK